MNPKARHKKVKSTATGVHDLQGMRAVMMCLDKGSPWVLEAQAMEPEGTSKTECPTPSFYFYSDLTNTKYSEHFHRDYRKEREDCR